jgi:hypothetical protein
MVTTLKFDCPQVAFRDKIGQFYGQGHIKRR